MQWLMEMPTVGGKVIPAHAMLSDRADDLIGAKLEEWRGDFNETQPHTSLGFMTPADEGPDLSFWPDTKPGKGQTESADDDGKAATQNRKVVATPIVRRASGVTNCSKPPAASKGRSAMPVT